jgi:lysophospholipid acyltransferase (LPLAT)-like uncharacterized protein
MLWRSYRVVAIIGEEHVDALVSGGKVYAPCYWHQHTLLIINVMHDWIRRGFRAGFVVSASVDGDVPARIAKSWGAEVIRGSAQRTGALAMRDIHGVMKKGVSLVTAADGPLGPKYHFKAGTVLMARIGDAPIVPLVCAADKAWYLDRWDDFMIPKPFARVVLAVGEPHAIPKGATIEDMEAHRGQLEQAMLALMQQAKSICASQS